MIPGGVADKLGNRYEAKLLVRYIIDVIAGKAQWIEFEGADPEFRGFEFALGRGERTEWFQTKISGPSGNWTLNALNKAGVFEAFAARLSQDRNSYCYFISQDNTKDLRTLSDKARRTNSTAQYIENLNEDEKIIFLSLKDKWGQTEDGRYNWLKRSYFMTLPQIELESMIDYFGGQTFWQAGEMIFPVLRDLLEANFNIRLTTERLRREIKTQGALKFKDWAFDQTIRDRLVEETEAYLQTYPLFGAGGETIDRPQVKIVTNKILGDNNQNLILIKGGAGSGKSGIVRGVIKKLHENNIPHLAFRADKFLSISTKEELGERLLGRHESPITTLKGTFPEELSVLIIDQVDSISEVAGRDSQIRSVILRLIDGASFFTNITIIIACRTYDLDNDPVLKNLQGKNTVFSIEIPSLAWGGEVEPLLKRKSVDIDKLSERQRQLLCLPINLALFLEIEDQDYSFTSRFGLYEKLFEKKQGDLVKRGGVSWSLMEPLSMLCDWMSDRQRLDAPAYTIDEYQNAVNILASEGLIISYRGQLNLFHESFFDYVYARRFLTREESLVDLLLSKEQFLFRRTQVRQILDVLRQDDYPQYIEELSSLLSNAQIRYHIKMAVCQWLSSIEGPTDQEFELLWRLNDANGDFNPLFRASLVSTHIWFEGLNKRNWIQQELESPDEYRVNAILWWLSKISLDLPKGVENVLRSWWGNNDANAVKIIEWFGRYLGLEMDKCLIQLCIDVIESHPPNLFKAAAHELVSQIAYTEKMKLNVDAGRILHSLFEAWYSINPDVNPFNDDKLTGIDYTSLSTVSEKSPLVLLEGFTDALVRAVDIVIAEREDSLNWYNLQNRSYAGYHFGFDEILWIYRIALLQVARIDGRIAISYLERLDPHKHACFMHLYLEAIQTIPDLLSNRLLSLSKDEKVFVAGWKGAVWMSFAEACRKAIPYLGIEDRIALEQTILKHYPEVDYARQIYSIIRERRENQYYTKKHALFYLNTSGRIQWYILETIGENLLSDDTKKRLYELRRKFPNEEVERPESLEAGVVQSPINSSHCKRMKDSDWLHAFEQYHNDERDSNSHNYLIGGARQLAMELQEATKSDPVRFSLLGLKIPDSAPSAYIEHILWGIAQTEPIDETALIRLIKRADQHVDKPFGRQIASCIQKHPAIGFNIEIINILIWYVLNGKEKDDVRLSNNKKADHVTIEGLISVAEQYYGSGINNERGASWDALAAILWTKADADAKLFVEEKIWETIDSALEIESSISVRCCILTPLVPLFNKNKERFAAAMRKLINPPANLAEQMVSTKCFPLITHQGLRLFPYITRWIPDLAKNLINELLNCMDRAVNLVCAWIVFRESFNKDEYVVLADSLSGLSDEHRCLMAAVASGNLTNNPKRAINLLIAFFEDDNIFVRKEAAQAFADIDPTEAELYLELARIFINSRSFAENPHAILHLLEKATCNVLALVILTARIFVDNKDQKKLYYGEMHQIQTLLKKEYVSSESNKEARERILDIIDDMLSNSIRGADDVVAIHDRW